MAENFDKIVAEADQAATMMMRTVPHILGDYLKGLVGQGFMREEAVVFTRDLQKYLFTNGRDIDLATLDNLSPPAKDPHVCGISCSPMYCNHANEMPAVCPCDDDCYCRVHGSCRGS